MSDIDWSSIPLGACDREGCKGLVQFNFICDECGYNHLTFGDDDE